MQNWRPVFEKYDPNHTGKIKFSEFRRILEEGNEQLNEDIPFDVLEKLLNSQHKFEDESITYDQFIELVCIKY